MLVNREIIRKSIFGSINETFLSNFSHVSHTYVEYDHGPGLLFKLKQSSNGDVRTLNSTTSIGNVGDSNDPSKVKHFGRLEFWKKKPFHLKPFF